MLKTFFTWALDWLSLIILATMVALHMGLHGWQAFIFGWACSWIYANRDRQFTIHNHTFIPHDMNKETVAKLVALQQSHIERN